MGQTESVLPTRRNIFEWHRQTSAEGEEGQSPDEDRDGYLARAFADLYCYMHVG